MVDFTTNMVARLGIYNILVFYLKAIQSQVSILVLGVAEICVIAIPG